MQSKNEYLKLLTKTHSETKREKSWILDEYYCNAGQTMRLLLSKTQNDTLQYAAPPPTLRSLYSNR